MAKYFDFKKEFKKALICYKKQLNITFMLRIYIIQ